MNANLLQRLSASGHAMPAIDRFSALANPKATSHLRQSGRLSVRHAQAAKGEFLTHSRARIAVFSFYIFPPHLSIFGAIETLMGLVSRTNRVLTHLYICAYINAAVKHIKRIERIGLTIAYPSSSFDRMEQRISAIFVGLWLFCLTMAPITESQDPKSSAHYCKKAL